MTRHLAPIVLAALLAAGGAFAGPHIAKEGEQCAGFIGTPCADGLWCEPKADQCHAADGSGSCVRAPEVCTREFRPVCGCDGKTYPNDCERRTRKVGLAHDGAC